MRISMPGGRCAAAVPGGRALHVSVPHARQAAGTDRSSPAWPVRAPMARLGVVLAVLLLAPPAVAQEIGRAHDAAGRAIGRTEATPGRQRHYDAAGRLVGRSETRGDTTRHHDGSGRALGRSERRGDVLRHYDSAGRAQGRTTWSGTTGRLFNASGRSQGRIERSGDSWRRYDAQGRMVSRGTGPMPTR